MEIHKDIWQQSRQYVQQFTTLLGKKVVYVGATEEVQCEKVSSSYNRELYGGCSTVMKQRIYLARSAHTRMAG